ncbi:MAG: hypothetical protein KDK78_10270, partial [Chlamydiia bacterium]|nr:hypothetical protein [Chlamydiia bacterium]
GVLGGKEFQLTDYRLRSLFAHVDYRDGALDLRNVRVSDVAGEFAADQIRLQRNQLDEWLLNVPLFTVSDFRPSLLRDASGNTQKPRPLMVSRLDLHDLKGRIADPSSFTATGSFSFVNPSKANIQNTILMIPSDILARIGLDLDLLTPVVGSVYYDIHDSRVHFTQFKDVYSEGRVSRFFLAGPNQPSYLDFDGNLNVKVRMKQYNLIFKLAELFTISVRGDVGHPSYSLQKLNEGHETVEEEVLDDAAA